MKRVPVNPVSMMASILAERARYFGSSDAYREIERPWSGSELALARGLGRCRTMVLAENCCPSISAVYELLPFSDDSLEQREFPGLEVVLGRHALSNIYNIKLENHAQLLVGEADVLEYPLRIRRVW